MKMATGPPTCAKCLNPIGARDIDLFACNEEVCMGCYVIYEELRYPRNFLERRGTKRGKRVCVPTLDVVASLDRLKAVDSYRIGTIASKPRRRSRT